MTYGSDKTGCFGNMIKVANGSYFDIVNPNPDEVDIQSIATALGNICRYGGHCGRFYSVAEHCVWAACLAWEDRCSDDIIRAVLMHDAAEAYVGDMIRPLKQHITEYKVFEHRLMNAIGKRFSIDFDAQQQWITKYDLQMLKAEKKELWPQDEATWFGLDGVASRRVEFAFLLPGAARKRFLKIAETYDIN